MIFGRTDEILKAVKTLADPNDSKKILIISGQEGSFHQEVARYAVRYVMERVKIYITPHAFKFFKSKIS